jgi:hypothetical protein
MITLQSLENLDENLLGYIFGFFHPAGKAITEIVDFSTVCLEQSFPGGIFTGEATVQ